MLFSSKFLGFHPALAVELKKFNIIKPQGQAQERMGLNLADLNLTIGRVDASLPQPGLAATITRHYNSKDNTWRIGATPRFKADNDNFIQIMPDGNERKYIKSGEHYVHADQAGNVWRLEITDTGYIVRNSQNPNLEHYDAKMRLSKAANAAGFGIRYEYDETHDRLQYVYTENGDYLELVYAGERVEQVCRFIAQDGQASKQIIAEYKYFPETNLLSNVELLIEDGHYYEVDYKYNADHSKLKLARQTDGTVRVFDWLDANHLIYKDGDVEYELERTDALRILRYADGTEVDFSIDAQAGVSRIHQDGREDIQFSYTGIFHQLESWQQLRHNDNTEETHSITYKYGVQPIRAQDGIYFKTTDVGADYLLASRHEVSSMHGSNSIAYGHDTQSLQRRFKHSYIVHHRIARPNNQIIITDNDGRAQYVISLIADEQVSVIEINYDEDTGLKNGRKVYATDTSFLDAFCGCLIDTGQVGGTRQAAELLIKNNQERREFVESEKSRMLLVQEQRFRYEFENGHIKIITQTYAKANDEASMVEEVKFVDIKTNSSSLQYMKQEHKQETKHDGIGRLRHTKDFAQREVEISHVRNTTIITSPGLSKVEVNRNAAGSEEEKIHSGLGFKYLLASTFDRAGHLRRLSKNGRNHYELRNVQGDLLAEVNHRGQLTEYQFDMENNQVRKSIFATLIDKDDLDSLTDSRLDAYTLLDNIRPELTTKDRHHFELYSLQGKHYATLTAEGTFKIHAAQNDWLTRLKQVVYSGKKTAAEIMAAARTTINERRGLYSNEIRPTRDANETREQISYQIGSQTGHLRVGSKVASYFIRNHFDVSGNKSACIHVSTSIEKHPEHEQHSDWMVDGYYDKFISQHPELIISTETWAHDGLKREIAHVDAAGFLTTTAYNDDENTQTITRYKQALTAQATATDFKIEDNAACEITRKTFNDAEELILIEHPNKLNEEFDYDEGGRQCLHLKYDASDVENKYKIARGFKKEFRTDGKLIREISGPGLNLLLQAHDEAEIEAIWQKYGTRYDYDDKGQLITETRPKGNVTHYFYDADGLKRASIDAVGRVVTYAYNSFDEIVEERAYNNLIKPENFEDFEITIGVYDLDLIEQLDFIKDDALDDVTKYDYDNQGREIERILPNGIVEKTVFDAFGGIKTITRQRSDSEAIIYSCEYTRDTRGRELTKTVTEHGITYSTSKTYEGDNLKTETDAEGNTITYGYDKRNRMTSKSFSDGTVISYQYDAIRRISKTVTKNGQSVTTKYTTDDAGRTQTTTHGDSSEDVSEFDVHQNLEHQKLANGEEVSHTYNTADKELSTTKGDRTATTAYDEAGFEESHTSLSGAKTDYERDPVGRETFSGNKAVGTRVETTYLTRKQHEVTAAGETHRISKGHHGKNVQEDIIVDDEVVLTTTNQYDDFNELCLQTLGSDEHARDVKFEKTVEHGLLCVTKRIDPQGLNYTSKTYFNKNKKKVATIDADGNITRYVYDCHGREQFIIKANGAVIEKLYDVHGKVCREINYATAHFLPASDLKLTAAQARPVASSADKITDTLRDDAGFVVYQIKNGQVTRLYNDEAGRPVKQRDIKKTLAATVTSRSLAQIKQSLDALEEDLVDRITRTVYDNEGDKEYTIDARGYITHHERMAGGRVINHHRYSNKPISMFGEAALYTPASLAALCQGAKCRTTTEIFDEADRKQTEIDSHGYVSNFTYDDKDRIVQTDKPAIPYHGARTAEILLAKRKLVADSKADYSLEVKYFSGKTVKSTTRVLNGGQERLTESYQFHNNGDRHQKTDRAGGVWDYTHDKAGHEREVLAPAVDITDVKQDGLELVPSLRKDCRLKTKKDYTPGGKLADLHTDADGPSARHQSYAYDPLQQVKSSTQHAVKVQNDHFDLNATPTLERDEVVVDVVIDEVKDVFQRALVKTDKLGRKEYTIYDAHDNPIYNVSVLGVVTERVYNSFNDCELKTVYATPIVVPEQYATTGISVEFLVKNIVHSADDRTETYECIHTGQQIRVCKDEVDCYEASLDSSEIQSLTKVRPETRSTINGFGEEELSEVRLNSAGDCAQTATITDFEYQQVPRLHLKENDHPRVKQQITSAQAHFDLAMTQAYHVAKVDAEGYLIVTSYNRDHKEIARIEFAEKQDIEQVKQGQIKTSAQDRHYLQLRDGANRVYLEIKPRRDVTQIIRDQDNKFHTVTAPTYPSLEHEYDAHDQPCQTRHEDGQYSTAKRNVLGYTIRTVDQGVMTAADNDQAPQLETIMQPDAYGHAAVSTAKGIPIYLQKKDGKLVEQDFKLESAPELVEEDRTTKQLVGALNKPIAVQDPMGHLRQYSLHKNSEVAREFFESEQRDVDEATGEIIPVQQMRDRRFIHAGNTDTIYAYEPHNITDKNGKVIASAKYTGQAATKNAFGDVASNSRIDAKGEHLLQTFKQDNVGNQIASTDKHGVKYLHGFNAKGKQTVTVKSAKEKIGDMTLAQALSEEHVADMIVEHTVLDKKDNSIRTYKPKYHDKQIGLNLAMALHHAECPENTISWPMPKDHLLQYKFFVRVKGTEEYIDLGQTHYNDQKSRMYVTMPADFEFGDVEFKVETHHAIIIPGKTREDIKQEMDILDEGAELERLKQCPFAKGLAKSAAEQLDPEEQLFWGYSREAYSSLSGSFEYAPKAQLKAKKEDESKAEDLLDREFGMESFFFNFDYANQSQTAILRVNKDEWTFKWKNKALLSWQAPEFLGPETSVDIDISYTLSSYNNDTQDYPGTFHFMNRESNGTVVNLERECFDDPSIKLGENYIDRWCCAHTNRLKKIDGNYVQEKVISDAGLKKAVARVNIDGRSVEIFNENYVGIHENSFKRTSHPSLIGPFDEKLDPNHTPEIMIRNPLFWHDDFITISEFQCVKAFMKVKKGSSNLSYEDFKKNYNLRKQANDGSLNVQIAGHFIVMRGEAFGAGNYEIKIKAKTVAGEWAKPRKPTKRYQVDTDGSIRGYFTVKEHADDLDIIPDAAPEPAVITPVHDMKPDAWNNAAEEMKPDGYQQWQSQGAKPQERANFITQNKRDATNQVVESTSPAVPVVDEEATKAAYLAALAKGIDIKKNPVLPVTRMQRLTKKTLHGIHGEEVAFTDAKGNEHIRRLDDNDILLDQDASGVRIEQAKQTQFGELKIHEDADGNRTINQRNLRGDVSGIIKPLVTELGHAQPIQYQTHQVVNESDEVIETTSAMGVKRAVAFDTHGSITLNAEPLPENKMAVTRTTYKPGTKTPELEQTPHGYKQTLSDDFGNVESTNDKPFSDEQGNEVHFKRNNLMQVVVEDHTNTAVNPDGTVIPSMKLQHQYHDDGVLYLIFDSISQSVERKHHNALRRLVRDQMFGPNREIWRDQQVYFDLLGDKPVSILDVNLIINYYRDANRNRVAQTSWLCDRHKDAQRFLETRWNVFDDADKLLVHQGKRNKDGDVGVYDAYDNLVERARLLTYNARGLRATDTLVSDGHKHERELQYDSWSRFTGMQGPDGAKYMVIGLNGDGQQMHFMDFLGENAPEINQLRRNGLITGKQIQQLAASRRGGQASIVDAVNKFIGKFDDLAIKNRTEVTSRDKRSGYVVKQTETTSDGKQKVVMPLTHSDFAAGFGPKQTHGDTSNLEQNYGSHTTRFPMLHDGQLKPHHAEIKGRYHQLRHHHSSPESTNKSEQYYDSAFMVHKHTDGTSEIYSRTFIHGLDHQLLIKRHYMKDYDNDKIYLAEVIFYQYYEGELIVTWSMNDKGEMLYYKDNVTPKINTDLSQIAITRNNIGVAQQIIAQAGYTSETLAIRFYGDPMFAGLIAVDNGLGEYEQLAAGRMIHLRAKPLPVHLNTRTHFIINLAAIKGSFDPIMPHLIMPRRKHKHGQKWKVWAVVVVEVAVLVVVAIYAPQLLPEMGKTAVMITTAMLAAVAADVAGQTMAIAFDMQKSYHFSRTGKAAAVAGVTAGVTQGLDMAANLSNFVRSSANAQKVIHIANSTLASALASNVINRQRGGDLDHHVLASLAASLVGQGAGSDGLELGQDVAASIESVTQGIIEGTLNHNSLDWGTLLIQGIGAGIRYNVDAKTDKMLTDRELNRKTQGKRVIDSESISYSHGTAEVLGDASNDDLYDGMLETPGAQQLSDDELMCRAPAGFADSMDERRIALMLQNEIAWQESRDLAVSVAKNLGQGAFELAQDAHYMMTNGPEAMRGMMRAVYNGAEFIGDMEHVITDPLFGIATSSAQQHRIAGYYTTAAEKVDFVVNASKTDLYGAVARHGVKSAIVVLASENLLLRQGVGRGIAGKGASQAAIRARVEANIASSGAARSSSNFMGLVGAETQVLDGYVADRWAAVTLSKGDVVFGGMPGQSKYYTSLETVMQSGGDKNILYDLLQVQKDPLRGYRNDIGIYVVNKTIKVPVGLTQANTSLGVGGGQQYMIKQFEKHLTRVEQLELREFYEQQVPKYKYSP